MSKARLVKSPRLTARKIAANRLNARRSTGPRTAQGKLRSSLNALRHGLCARPLREAMRALGEDPREFDRLRRDFIASFEPAAPFERALVEDLAYLWWKKSRAERSQAGVQVHNVEQAQLSRLRELHEANRLSVDEPQDVLRATGLLRAKDCAGKFEEAARFLEVFLADLERGRGSVGAEALVRALYGSLPTVRANFIVSLHKRLRAAEDREAREQADEFAEDGPATAAPDDAEAEEDEDEQAGDEDPDGPDPEEPDEGGGSEGDEEDDLSPRALRAMLVNVVTDELEEVWKSHQDFLARHKEFSPAARAAALAPTDSRWEWLLRYENSIELQIDRKLRQLQKIQSLRRWGDQPWHFSRRAWRYDFPPARRPEAGRPPAGLGSIAPRRNEARHDGMPRRLAPGVPRRGLPRTGVSPAGGNSGNVKSAATKPRSVSKQNAAPRKPSQSEPATKPRRTAGMPERTRAQAQRHRLPAGGRRSSYLRARH